MVDRLKGKRIIITGAADNIGKEAARELVAEGARVVIGDIDAAKGAATAAELGPMAHFLRVDLAAGEAAVAAFIDAAAGWLGGLDVLCQNAGVQIAGDIGAFSASNWEKMFAVNVTAQFFGVKHALPHLRKAGKGSIVNMASAAGVRGAPGLVGYSASKGASVLFGNALARELGAENIRVNTICPGWVDTAFNQPAIDRMGGRAVQDELVKREVPLGRQGQPREIAPLYVYLASDQSSFMTGQVLVIDGGVYN